ncbi:SID1 transmembrane family member 1 [Orchesella cincta]|uniref:SID1 transmembrane family member 1 n=1 Tax=Orchesella cincta TaxID=48709 RepID=A0A1D2M7Z3_ORCCI|nr:SID1 transmembrane family member 1 [Orchesella cincta]
MSMVFQSLLITLVLWEVSSFTIEPIIKNDVRVNENYIGSVNLSSPVTFIYELKPLKEKRLTTNIRFRLKVSLVPDEIGVVTPDKNLSVTILQPSAVSSSFQLPHFSKRHANKGRSINAESYHAERTLCILDGDPNSPVFVSVILSTGSPSNISYSIVIATEHDFQLAFETSRNVTVSAVKPIYYNFRFDESTPQAVKIMADSNDSIGSCLTLSVQAPHCPIFDQEENVHYEGIYETMSISGTMTVKRQEPFLEGFILVIIVHTSQDECLRKDPFSLPLPYIPDLSNVTGIFNTFSGIFPYPGNPVDRDINLIVTIGPVDNGHQLLAKCMSWFMPNAIVFVIALSVLLVFLPRRHQLMRKLLLANVGESEDDPLLPLDSSSRFDDHCENNLGNHSQGQGFLSRLKADKYLADFINDSSTTQQTPSRNGAAFFHHISIVAIFYCIPVCQFALYYFRVSKAIGNYDMCYYNYRCAHAEGPFIDFNHFISNAAYILFGILFLMIVRKHEVQYLEVEKIKENERSQSANSFTTDTTDENHGEAEAVFVGAARISEIERQDLGIPANFGLFKALGISLIVEGVLSAAYHLCPNQSTFQFDTCFMYVMAVLILVKLYQFRHPRIFKPNHALWTLATIVGLSVLGLLAEGVITSTNKTALASIFVLVQLLVTLYISFDYCFIGYLKDPDSGKTVTGWKMFWLIFEWKTWKCENVRGGRLIFPICSISLSISLAICWGQIRWSFSTYLLYLFIAHVVFNVAHYAFMKSVVHRESKQKSWIQPLVFFSLAAITGGFAVSFYMDVATKWELTAAESRAINQECLGLFFLGPFEYYDSHDAWHFLSATALFFSFMGLLVMDDDLVATPRAEYIPFLTKN